MTGFWITVNAHVAHHLHHVYGWPVQHVFRTVWQVLVGR
jgi:hypothetical protein